MATQEAPPFWWQKPGWQALLLSPLAWFYGRISAKRMELPASQAMNIPVICVGNFVVGGAGKNANRYGTCNQSQTNGPKARHIITRLWRWRG